MMAKWPHSNFCHLDTNNSFTAWHSYDYDSLNRLLQILVSIHKKNRLWPCLILPKKKHYQMYFQALNFLLHKNACTSHSYTDNNLLNWCIKIVQQTHLCTHSCCVSVTSPLHMLTFSKLYCNKYIYCLHWFSMACITSWGTTDSSFPVTFNKLTSER